MRVRARKIKKEKFTVSASTKREIPLQVRSHTCTNMHILGGILISIILGVYFKVRNIPRKVAFKEYDDFTWLGSIPHNRSSFTQGLSYHEGVLYEGTGLYGESNMFKIDPRDGRVLKKSNNPLPSHLFGEGIAIFNGKLIQLTWKNRLGFMYNATTLEILDNDSNSIPSTFEFDTKSGEGWGITYDPIENELIVSDGSHYLHFWDADTLEEKRRVEVYRVEPVTGKHIYVPRLNELEYLNGRILANVWYMDYIVSIDPSSGKVKKIYNFTQLWPFNEREQSGYEVDCLNGIAVSNIPGEIFITGKLWPEIHRVRLHEY